MKSDEIKHVEDEIIRRTGCRVLRCRTHQGSMRPYIYVRLWRLAAFAKDETEWLRSLGFQIWLSARRPSLCNDDHQIEFHLHRGTL